MVEFLFSLSRILSCRLQNFFSWLGLRNLASRWNSRARILFGNLISSINFWWPWSWNRGKTYSFNIQSLFRNILSWSLGRLSIWIILLISYIRHYLPGWRLSILWVMSVLHNLLIVLFWGKYFFALFLLIRNFVVPFRPWTLWTNQFSLFMLWILINNPWLFIWRLWSIIR